MKMNAVFQCKSPSLGETPCEIRKVITLTDGAYRYFKNHLTEDYPFLRENRNQMGYDNGIRQCLLVMGESSEDGVLVDSSGYGYARYAAPFLGARSYLIVQQQIQSQDSNAKRSLSAEEVACIQQRHKLWSHNAGGTQADFSGCRIADMNLAKGEWNGAVFCNAVLENVDLTGAGICFGNFSGARLIGCRLDACAAEESNFRKAILENCTLTQARMSHSDFSGAQLRNCVVWEAELRHCQMEGVSLEGTDLEEAMTLNQDLTGQQCSNPGMTMG